jgi:hypothetical protein
MTEKDLISALTGMILGDANLHRTKGSKNALLRINHSIKQENYLLWKSKIIKEITSFKIVPYKTNLNGKDIEMVNLYTKCHPYFTRLRENFYWQGRKSVDAFIMKRLTPIGLAIWIMDDGNNNNENIRLATYNFNEAEHWLMKYWIEKNFNIKVAIRKLRNYYFLEFTQKNAREVLKICEPFIFKELRYKFPSDVNPPKLLRDKTTGQFSKWIRGGDIV